MVTTLVTVSESARLLCALAIGRWGGDRTVSGQVMRVARYRFAATFRRTRGSYVAIVVLIGLTGGIAMGSIAAARRTQASFAMFLASTSPSDLSLTASAPSLAKDLERLPGVQRVEAASLSVNAFPLGRIGALVLANLVAALPGRYAARTPAALVLRAD